MMRKLAWVALLFLLAAGLFFLLDEGKEIVAATPVEETPADGPVSFGIYSYELADSGNGTAAVLHMFLFGKGENASVKLSCSPRPIQRTFLVLEHARAPGISAGLGKEIERELSLCGISSRGASISEAVSSENSVVVAATGAIPEALLGNASSMASGNNRIIVVQSARGKAISESGDLLFANLSAGAELVGLEPGGEAKAAKDVARKAVFSSEAEWREIAAGQGNFTAAYFSNESALYCRAIYADKKGACRVADSGRAVKPEGKLSGPKEIRQGEKAAFDFSLGGSSEVGRNLRFYAVLLQGRKEVARREIAGGQIRQGYESMFSIEAPEGGKYILQAVDQFGRKHASAYFEAVALQVQAVLQEGNSYEFYIAASGEPVTGMVSARIDDGERKQFYANSGKLVILASPKAGNRTLHFEYRGMQTEAGIEATGGGLLEAYVQLGIPALVFLFAVFLLLRAKRKVKYCITFPEVAQGKAVMVHVPQDEVLSAWKEADRKIGGYSLPCSPDEIGNALCEKRDGMKEVSLNHDSVLGVLRKLVARGRIIETNGLFVPANKAGGFAPEQLWALRFLHDLMVERGARFERKTVQKIAGRGVELAVFTGKESVLRNVGRERRAVVFPSREGLELFERSLKRHEPENVRIKIALSNGKIFFACATRAEIEPLLP